MVRSMTPFERSHPKTINGSRRQRIARGSGTVSYTHLDVYKRQGKIWSVPVHDLVRVRTGERGVDAI